MRATPSFTCLPYVTSFPHPLPPYCPTPSLPLCRGSFLCLLGSPFQSLSLILSAPFPSLLPLFIASSNSWSKASQQEEHLQLVRRESGDPPMPLVCYGAT